MLVQLGKEINMYLNKINSIHTALKYIDAAKQRAKELKDKGYMVLYEQSEQGIYVTWYLTSDELTIN
jgi:hypothetical protein